MWEAGKSKTCRAVAQDRRLETQAGFLFVFFFSFGRAMQLEAVNTLDCQGPPSVLVLSFSGKPVFPS